MSCIRSNSSDNLHGGMLKWQQVRETVSCFRNSSSEELFYIQSQQFRGTVSWFRSSRSEELSRVLVAAVQRTCVIVKYSSSSEELGHVLQHQFTGNMSRFSSSIAENCFMSQQFRRTVSCSRSRISDKMVSCYNSSRLEKLCQLTIAAVQRYCDMFIMSSSEFQNCVMFQWQQCRGTNVSCFSSSSLIVSQIRLKQSTVPSHPRSPISPSLILLSPKSKPSVSSPWSV